MAARDYPYGAFNFRVEIGSGETMGGFSDVSGLNTEITVAEYRNGNEKENHVRKVPGMHKVGDVTLKRGIIDSKGLWEWIKETRRNGYTTKKEVKIVLRDEAGADVQAWKLRGATPIKYTGPTLAGKGGSDVAMEELVLSAEAIEIE